MPVDIRSFFAKAPAAKKKKKGDSTEKESNVDTAPSNSGKGRNLKRVVPEENSGGSSKAGRKKTRSSRDESEPTTKSAGSGSKRKSTASDRIEVSATDYFAKAGGKTESSPPKRIKRSPLKSNEPSIDLTGDDDAEYSEDEDRRRTTKNDRRVRESPKKAPLPATTTPAKETISSRTPKKQSPKLAKPPLLKPTRENASFDIDAAPPACLDGLTFVFTGVLPNISRDDAQEWIKIMGGRVTGSVSSKTDYLVVGPELEDGRHFSEGSKYKKASTLSNVVIVEGGERFYGLLTLYKEKALGSQEQPTTTVSQGMKPPPTASLVASAVAKDTPEVVPKTEALATPAQRNPYKKRSNPYAKSAGGPSRAAEQRKKDPIPPVPSRAIKSDTSEQALWVDRYKPSNSSEILGNGEAVRKLKVWLSRWEERFNCAGAIGKAFSNPQGPWKAALLSGPPGIGKTTTATLVAREAGREVVEYNASDVRSKRALKEDLGDVTGSKSIDFRSQTPKTTKRCIIMDEVDGMGAGDRSGIAELIQMIKHSRVPIICICNDRQAQKIKSLVPYCMDLKYRRPMKTVIASRAIEVAAREGLQVERNAAEAICESCGGDVRQVLNCLQMWASAADRQTMTYKDLKERQNSINKDEILRVSLFDAARLIVEGRRGLVGNSNATVARDHFARRNDAFFVDYSFTGLIVQQNWLKVMQGQFAEAKRSDVPERLEEALVRMDEAATSMSDYAMVENKLRTDQNWSVLPFVGCLAVKTGFHAGGENGGMLPGFPEFTTWLGRNSTKGKRERLLSELNHHMNYRISGGTTEMRLSYLPILRQRFISLIGSKTDAQGIDKAIDLMDAYGLDRDDLFEKFDEFKMDSKDKGFAQFDSKKKAAFTRAYNAGSHTSQALVAEQGGLNKKGRRAGSGSAMADTFDPDAINDDDKGVQEEDEEDEEVDAAKIAAMFKKKGKKRAAPTQRGKAKTATKKKK